MKVIDLAPAREERSSGLLAKVSSSIRSGKSSSEDAPAQTRMIAALQKSLGNQYVLLRDVKLEDLEMPVPLILVGPPGVHVLVPSSLRGVYRAREDQWEKLEERRQKYRPVNPNLLTRTLLMGRSVHAFLVYRGRPVPEVVSILFFSDPGIHVESVRPVVRLVMADAQDRFIAGLMQSRILLNQEEIDRIVRSLSREKGGVGVEDVEAPSVEQDAFSFYEAEAPRQKSNLEQELAAGEQAFLSRLTRVPFTGRQWMILGAIILVNILLLAVLVLVVLVNS